MDSHDDVHGVLDGFDLSSVDISQLDLSLGLGPTSVSTGIGMDVNCLDPLLYIDWSQSIGDVHENSGIAPSQLLSPSGTDSNSNSFTYDFSFSPPSPRSLSLPSPPTTATDPPSPERASLNTKPESPVYIGTRILNLDPLLFNQPQPTASTDSAGLPSSRFQTTTATQESTRPPSPLPTRKSGKTVKTKSSHTTIERRYRTNLNTRIVGLRLAVPALRVLEKDLALLESHPLEGTRAGECEILSDERGFVDGVKAAKKNSKANILGKATEYIRVLKRRELRLRNSLCSLRGLMLSILPAENGEEIIKRWEQTQPPEISDELPVELNGAEDEDGEDEGDPDDEVDDERPKKKAKVLKTSAVLNPLSVSSGEPPVKRKRGRPRKIPLPSVTTDLSAGVRTLPSPPAEEMEITPLTQMQTPANYFLAAFAFFSLFPLSSIPTSASSAPSTYQGSVLGNSVSIVHEPRTWDIVRFAQMLTSAALLMSLVAPHIRHFVSTTRSKGSAPHVSQINDILEELSSISGLANAVMKYLLGRRCSSAELQNLSSLTGSLLIEDDKLSLIPRIRLVVELSQATQDNDDKLSTLAEHALLLYPVIPNYAKGIWSRSTFAAEFDLSMAYSIVTSGTGSSARDALEKYSKRKHEKVKLSRTFVDVVDGHVPVSSLAFDAGTYDDDESITVLRKAMELFGSIFPERTLVLEQAFCCNQAPPAILTPPPSPSHRDRKQRGKQYDLRVLMGHPVFDCPVLEHAAEKVVKMLENL